MLLAICKGNPTITVGFPSQRASNAGSISTLWRHHWLRKSGYIQWWTIFQKWKKSIESITYQTLRTRWWYVCLAQLTRWQLIHLARKLQPCSSQKSLRQVFRPQQILNEVVVGHQWVDSLCPGWRYMDKDLILSNHKPKQCCFICNEVIIGANFRHTCIWLRSKTSVQRWYVRKFRL